jgi:hypothetical protein
VGFHGDIDQIESLARFLEFNRLSIEALCYKADVEESKLQKTLLAAKVITGDEGDTPSAYLFRLDLFQEAREDSMPPSQDRCASIP